jgi:hypothetical protein
LLLLSSRNRRGSATRIRRIRELRGNKIIRRNNSDSFLIELRSKVFFKERVASRSIKVIVIINSRGIRRTIISNLRRVI